METHFFQPEYAGLYEGDNYYPDTLLSIAHIVFPKLQEIHMYNNSIESVEVLPWVRMPALKNLIFGILWLMQPTIA